MRGRGFPPGALRHPWRTAAICALLFLVVWLGVTAWNHQLNVKTGVVGLVMTVVTFLVVRGVVAADRQWPRS